ncbi:junctional cadherin 5-associated protein isoform X1 [Camelus bactrianus]|uniref:Junctional cadherin 5-associated protein isoform X1 n=2 Tax=Camelus bactrianus TaxID=9837 RepID=A0AC58PX04_CAMBA
MYSVEDLLVSHGYKLPRKPPAPHESDCEGRQPARARAQAGPGLLNGCEDGPAGRPRGETSLGKGRVSNPESSRRRPRVHGEPPDASAPRISEAGFYHQPVLAWSSQPLAGRSHAYWRRRDQEGSGLLGPRDREDAKVRGMAQAHSLPERMREGPREVGGRTEDVMRKAVWEEELGMAGPAKWQNVGPGSWNQPRKLGRQMSDGIGEKLFQDLHPFVRGEHMLSKGKSQSLPRVLSPESLSCIDIPIPLSDGPLAAVPKGPFHSPNRAPDLEAARNPEKGGSSAPSPRPKFGRPIKPPSYDSHQYSRAGAEISDLTASQPPDPRASHPAKTKDARQELGVPDPGLEPPGYVPPPSYRSPPQPGTYPCSEDAAPLHDGGGCRAQPHSGEKAGAGGRLPPGSLSAGPECSPGPHSPCGVPPQPHPTTAYGSVLYIPFDDPRIRHIKLARPQGFWEEVKPDGQPCPSGPAPAPEPALGSLRCEGASWNPSGNERDPAPATPSPPWLWGQPLRDGENGGFPDQRDHCVITQRQRSDVGDGPLGLPESHVSSLNPAGESTCETQTQLRKFETGMQIKKSSKKKMNETIFCLVSVPVKSESYLPDTDTNNNDLKPSMDKKNGPDKSAALQEQSLLSLSSTDLELQALMGGLAGRTEPQKQDLGWPRGDRHTDDLRFTHPAKHRELTCPGSWPGHQYRDQQTQTSFPEESQSPRPLPGEKPGGSPDPVLTLKCLNPVPFEVQMQVALASSDLTHRPGAHPLKSQGSLSPSNNSAFSRASSCVSQAPVPRAGQAHPGVDSRGRGTSPVPRGEVVKGETTGPCNSQQLFGQFLLKPVSRRPWDLISQLESFNKELQEEEASSRSSSSSEDGETGQPWEGRAGPAAQHAGCCEDRVEEAPRRLVAEDPGPWWGSVTSKSESWSEEQQPRCRSPLQVEGSRGAAWLPPPGSSIAGEGDQEVEDGVTEPAVSPGPAKQVTSSRLSDAMPVSPVDPAEAREPLLSQEPPGGLSAPELSEASPSRAGGGEQGSSGVLVSLSLTGKLRGLSAPDLRSVGLTLAQERSASTVAGSSGEASAIEIPPNESLQARAARILGIEVAMESLLPGAGRVGQSQHPEPDGGTHGPESPGQESVSSPACRDEPSASTDAFHGRRKCGWTTSPLFVGERDVPRRAPQASEPKGVDGDTLIPSQAPEPQPSLQEPQPFHPKDVGTKPPFRSTLFHFIERTPSLAASEKRLRSTSKVIESLQEKLASPPRRADPDRLMRMKEVSSVSRLRLLTSRGTESAEEAEEPTAEKSSRVRPLNARHLLSESRGAFPLGEDGHQAARREENGGQDFWCPDSYDPSRVERV